MNRQSAEDFRAVKIDDTRTVHAFIHNQNIQHQE